VAGGLVVSAFAILVAVGVFNSNVTRVLIDEARAPMGGATEDQSAMQAASTQPAVRQDPALVSDPATLASVNASSPRLETPSREAIVSAYHTALQSQAPAARTANEAAAPSKTLDAETLAALMTRARSLLALGDIAAARLLLERAANARDATAAFLLAQTYDPAVLRVRDTLVPQGRQLWLGGRATASHSISGLISTHLEDAVPQSLRMFAAMIVRLESGMRTKADVRRPL
jgi:hypothetical protein